MKVLWIVNTLFPEVAELLQISTPVTGGWLSSCAKVLTTRYPHMELAIAVLYNGAGIKRIRGKYHYFLIPYRHYDRYDTSVEKAFKKISQDFRPDIIHIHGTEYPHSLAALNGCNHGKIVVSIQGLVSVYSSYYCGGITYPDLRKFRTLRDIVKHDSLLVQQQKMALRGDYEIKLLQKARNIIGRTSWDKAHVWAINPAARYYACNETLRESFYIEKWTLSSCQRHSLFLSQGHYPIKGLHKMIEALPMILRHYPDTQVYVAGHNPMSASWGKMCGYGKYIAHLIKSNRLEQNIHFVGNLSENEMVSRYKQSHLFICPSAIENSPNSVGEAQLLGVPCIASYVGGTPDMITHEKSGLLYRFEETAELAAHICRLFSDDDWCERLGSGGRKEAIHRHDYRTIARQLYDIYKGLSS